MHKQILSVSPVCSVWFLLACSGCKSFSQSSHARPCGHKYPSHTNKACTPGRLRGIQRLPDQASLIKQTAPGGQVKRESLGNYINTLMRLWSGSQESIRSSNVDSKWLNHKDQEIEMCFVVVVVVISLFRSTQTCTCLCTDGQFPPPAPTPPPTLTSPLQPPADSLPEAVHVYLPQIDVSTCTQRALCPVAIRAPLLGLITKLGREACKLEKTLLFECNYKNSPLFIALSVYYLLLFSLLCKWRSLGKLPGCGCRDRAEGAVPLIKPQVTLIPGTSLRNHDTALPLQRLM